MSISLAQSCAFPQDLDAAAHQILQELGDQFRITTDLLNNLSSSSSGIGPLVDQGEGILNQLLILGDGSSQIKDTGDVEDQFGLPASSPTPCEDEQALFYSGISMVAGVLYIGGDKSPNVADESNIEVLRRIYLASGRDFDKLSSLLNLNRVLVIHSKVQIQKVPAKASGVAYSDDEIRRLLNATYLQSENIVRNPDGSAVAVTSDFLAVNQSLDETIRVSGLKSADIATTVIHHLTIDNSTKSVNHFTQAGYIGSQLSAILAGEDLIDVTPSPVENSNKVSVSEASSIISSIDFIVERFEGLTPTDRVKLHDKLMAQMSTLTIQHKNTIVQSKFQVSVREQLDTYDLLRTKHTKDEDLICLFELRPELKGIYFNAPNSLIIQAINTPIAVGSTTASNKFLNSKPKTGLNNQVLVAMASDLDQATTNVDAFTKGSLLKARQNLVDFGGKDPFIVNIDDGIIQGQPSAGTPTDVILRNINFDKSFDIELHLGKVDKALADLGNFLNDNIAKPLAHIIGIIVTLMKAAENAVDTLVDMARAAILPLKQKVDSFMSKYLSLTGSGTFNSSLLKCAVNFDIQLAAPILDSLLSLVDELATQVRKLLSKLGEAVYNVVNKMLCTPINLMNAFLGQTSLSLPSACQLPTVNLGPDLEKALGDLRDSFSNKSIIFTNFSRDLVRYQVVITDAPEKLKQFQASSVCKSPGIQNFYNSALLNLGGGIRSPI